MAEKATKKPTGAQHQAQVENHFCAVEQLEVSEGEMPLPGKKKGQYIGSAATHMLTL